MCGKKRRGLSGPRPPICRRYTGARRIFVNPSRRDLGLILPALAVATASAQENKTLPSKAFKYEDLPVKVNGENKSRAVFNGETHSGFPIELHMTELAAGQVPHAPHRSEEHTSELQSPCN